MSFLNSITNNAKQFEKPFLHWELNKPLTDQQINEIINVDIANLDSVSATYLKISRLAGL